MNIEKYASTPQYQEWRNECYRLKKQMESLPVSDVKRWDAELRLEELKKLMHI